MSHLASHSIQVTNTTWAQNILDNGAVATRFEEAGFPEPSTPLPIPKVTLSKEQNDILEVVMRGENVFFTGPAGMLCFYPRYLSCPRFFQAQGNRSFSAPSSRNCLKLKNQKQLLLPRRPELLLCRLVGRLSTLSGGSGLGQKWSTFCYEKSDERIKKGGEGLKC